MAQWTNLQRIKIFVNSARLYITCKRSGALQLVELGLTAGSPAVWQTKFGRGLNFQNLAVDRNVRFSALFSQGTALFQSIANTFKANTATRLFYGV